MLPSCLISVAVAVMILSICCKNCSILHAGILASLVIILSVIFAYQEKLQQFMAEIAGDDTAAGSRLRKAD